jgi:hypothetical protein
MLNSHSGELYKVAIEALMFADEKKTYPGSRNIEFDRENYQEFRLLYAIIQKVRSRDEGIRLQAIAEFRELIVSGVFPEPKKIPESNNHIKYCYHYHSAPVISFHLVYQQGIQFLPFF